MALSLSPALSPEPQSPQPIPNLLLSSSRCDPPLSRRSWRSEFFADGLFLGTLPLPYFGLLIPERFKGLCDGFFGEFLRGVHVLGFESLGFRVQGLGFRVWMSGDLDTRVLSASLHTDVMLKLNRSSKQSLHRDRKRANTNFSFMQGLRFGERSLVLLTWFKQALTWLSRRRLRF